MRSIQLTKEAKHSYKIGMDEIIGLESEMRKVFKPIEDWIRDNLYWERDNKHLVETAEYKSRDGFIPYSHNCGGLEVRCVIPKCEEYNFSFIDFGECDECKPGDYNQCGYKGQECSYESEGHLDAMFRVWLKFEGIRDGKLKFYLYAGGGNGDAPYFRTEYEHDVFEADFECNSVSGLSRAASKHIKALLKAVQGE